MRKEDSKKEAAKKQLKDYQIESKLREMYEKKKMTAGEIAKKSNVSRDPDFGFVPVESVWAKPLYINC